MSAELQYRQSPLPFQRSCHSDWVMTRRKLWGGQALLPAPAGHVSSPPPTQRGGAPARLEPRLGWTTPTITEIVDTPERVLLAALDWLERQPPPVGVQLIIRAFVAVSSLSLADVTGPTRVRFPTRVRQLAMVVARRRTGVSTSEIGRRFGGRDHTTVLNAIAKVGTIVDQALAKRGGAG